MTTTPQASMCECEECLALRAAERRPRLWRDRTSPSTETRLAGLITLKIK
jgi:hypothetical protein